MHYRNVYKSLQRTSQLHNQQNYTTEDQLQNLLKELYNVNVNRLGSKDIIEFQKKKEEDNHHNYTNMAHNIKHYIVQNHHNY